MPLRSFILIFAVLLPLAPPAAAQSSFRTNSVAYEHQAEIDVVIEESAGQPRMARLAAVVVWRPDRKWSEPVPAISAARRDSLAARSGAPRPGWVQRGGCTRVRCANTEFDSISRTLRVMGRQWEIPRGDSMRVVLVDDANHGAPSVQSYVIRSRPRRIREPNSPEDSFREVGREHAYFLRVIRSHRPLRRYLDEALDTRRF